MAATRTRADRPRAARRPPGISSRSSTARAPRASSAASREALERAQAFAERYAGKLGELDSAGLREAMERAGRDPRAGRPRRLPTRRCASRPTPPTRPTARCCSSVQEQRDGDPDDAAVLRAGVGGARRRARRGAARRRRAGLLPPPPAQRAPLPRAPAVRARGADPRREVAHRRERLDAAVRGADLGDRGRAARRRRASGGAGRARRRAQPPVAARPRGAAHDRRGRHRGARAGPAHARVPVQHAARRQGDRRPPAPLPALAGGAQPRQRGQRRVGAGADRGGARPL